MPDPYCDSPAYAGAVGSEVKGALDPQQLTDVLTAYSAEQGKIHSRVPDRLVSSCCEEHHLLLEPSVTF